MGFGFEPELGFGDDPEAPALDSLFMEGEPGEDDGGLGPPDPGATTSALLAIMVDAGEAYLKAERDAQDRAKMAGVVKELHQFAAREEKQRDALLGSSPAMKYLGRRAR